MCYCREWVEFRPRKPDDMMRTRKKYLKQTSNIYTHTHTHIYRSHYILECLTYQTNIPAKALNRYDTYSQK